MTQADTDAPGGDDSDLARVPSHVGGLDAVLNGGFLQGGLYMIQGPPGAGKTILASQVLYGRASAGERALFVTVLGENHGRMFAHLRPMRFFDVSLVPDQVTYISAYHALGDEGLKGVATLLRREVHARGATLLVLDGVSAVEAKAGSKFEMQRFTHELQTLASMTGCTMFLLTTSDSDEAPERTMVDGLIELRQQGLGVRNERRMLVQKLRGSGCLEGEHAFRITGDGITVFPRIEALFAMPTRRDRPPVARVSTGVASLDAMFGGGIPAWTVTALVGPSGAGKTTLGLQFLSVSNAAEPGLLFGCDETPERLRLRAATMKLGVVEAEQRGDVELLWYPVGEHILDELGHRLLDAVRRRGVKRLVIDGVAGFQQAALEPERIVRFWSALSNELRALGVTTLHTSWIADLVANEFRVPASGVAPLAETIVLMRYVELRSQLHRLISLVKVRDSTFDPTIRAFTIGDAGIVVGELFEGAEAALSGRIRDVEISGIAVSSGVGRDPSGGGTGLPA
jgi:circadian clock protein KaiC